MENLGTGRHTSCCSFSWDSFFKSSLAISIPCLIKSARASKYWKKPTENIHQYHNKCAVYRFTPLLPLTIIRSLTCFPLLICHCVGDLSKHQYRLHVSDPMYNTMKIDVNKILFYMHNWLKKIFYRKPAICIVM